MWFHKMLHLICPHSCLRNAEWQQSSLVCKKCGSILALRYLNEEEVQVYVYYNHKEYAKEIVSREDTKRLASERDALGVIHCTRFDEFLHNFKQRPLDVFPVSGDAERFSASEESSDASGVRRSDRELEDQTRL